MFKIDDIVRVSKKAEEGIYKLRVGYKGTVTSVEPGGCWVALHTGKLFFFNEELEYAE